MKESSSKDNQKNDDRREVSETTTSTEFVLPSRDDRKRFLGCLASVFASAYDYEEIDQNDDFEEALEREIQDDPTLQDSSLDQPLENDDLALRRYRQRRYTVLSNVLLRSAYYLDLEEEDAGAFLPMLSNLLEPQSRPKVSSSDCQTDSDESKVTYSAIIHSFEESSVETVLDKEIDSLDGLRPFIETMDSDAGFMCLTMFLLRYLLEGAQGYDARVRHSVKKLANILFSREILAMRTEESVEDVILIATRRFEALERAIAQKLLFLTKQQKKLKSEEENKEKSKRFSRKNVVRGLKIGGAAVAAGTLFAVTGGLAAPAIAAGVGALAGGTAITASVATLLTSTTALTAIFGVGGGGLAAYKMNRRTQNLTEFAFHQEYRKDGDDTDVDLFSTIAISGWLRDKYDFQRPWGLTPSDPPLTDRVELLERFYVIHRPENVTKAETILKDWKGREGMLWDVTRQKYGTDPEHLFPLDDGPRFRGQLTAHQAEALEACLAAILVSLAEHKDRVEPVPTVTTSKPSKPKDSSELTPSLSKRSGESMPTPVNGAAEESTNIGAELPKHVRTVWDYNSMYGGELFTLKWESALLGKLCESVRNMAFDVIVNKGTSEIVKRTVFATLMAAVAWPAALTKVANMIDENWTMVVERADEAGKELAKSLLFSASGNRPVSLIGYSFGARIVFSCLEELARYQDIWMDFQAENDRNEDEFNSRIQGVKSTEMREPASVVEDVILMGIPKRLNLDTWQACRRIVAGRLVNCFSQKDLILSLMFQFKRPGLKPVCGTCPVNVYGVENFDVTDLVLGHSDYTLVVGDILKRVHYLQPFQSRAETKVVVPVVVG